MTEKELSGYSWIKWEVRGIEGDIAIREAEIAELEQEIGPGAIKMDGMPHGSSPGDPVAMMAIKMAALHEELKGLKADLEDHRAELIKKEREIRKFISSVEDEEIKLIIKWRFIDLLDWIEIAGRLEDMTGKNVDRSTPGKKMRRFLRKNKKEAQISHISHEALIQ